MTNLLISQFNNKNKEYKAPFKKNADGFDNSIIYAHNNIHSTPARGKLIKSSIFSAPAVFVKDTIEDVSSLKTAIKNGKSDDYKLGRVNDLSLKFGSLVIAAYLFTKKNTASKKLMELIGFGSFLGSMVLWPKLFIQTPAKLLHGIDIFQEYEDSEGRKKKFFQDPQYTPWDILTPEEMSKLGDKLNVPKGITNRSDLTKEKAHKIALQSNTLWMLSAGFGVPILSSFICSGIEKYLPNVVTKPMRNFSDNQMTSLLNTATTDINKVKPDKSIVKTFNSFIAGKENVPITEEFLSDLTEAITGDHILAQKLKEDLKTNPLFTQSNGNAKINGFIDRIFEQFSEDLKQSGITRETFNEIFEKSKNNNDAKSVLKNIKSALQRSIKTGNRHRNFDFIDRVFDAGADIQPDITFSGEAKTLAENLNLLFARLSQASKTIHNNLSLKSANSEEALATRYWQSFTSKLTKILNISAKDMQRIINSDDSSNNIITKYLTDIAQNNDIYNTKFNSLLSVYSEFINGMDLQIVPDVLLQEHYGHQLRTDIVTGLKKTQNQIDSIYGAFLNTIKNNGLTNTANTIDLRRGNVISENINLNNLSKISSFSRTLLTFDFMKRKTDNVLLNQIKAILSNMGLTSVTNEKIEEIAEEAERIIFNGKFADYSTKFGTNGDAGLNYRVITTLLFNPEYLSQNTKDLLINNPEKKLPSNIFKNFLNHMFDLVGNTYNPHFAQINTEAITAQEYSGSRSVMNIMPKFYHNLIGDETCSMIKKTCEQITNNKIWATKFAKLGIAVAAITVASQFFFGRLNNDIKIVPQESEAS